MREPQEQVRMIGCRKKQDDGNAEQISGKQSRGEHTLSANEEKDDRHYDAEQSHEEDQGKQYVYGWMHELEMHGARILKAFLPDFWIRRLRLSGYDTQNYE